MENYEQFKYSHVCDCCEEVAYPLNLVTFRTLPVYGRNTETGERVLVHPPKPATAWVCDSCLPGYQEEDK
jgi:hypothetical protein